MTDFKILDETILNYGSNEELYLMLIRYKGKHFIVVDGRRVRLGTLQARSRKEADVMFFQIETRMKTYTDFQEAVNTFMQAYSMKSVREFMFIINILNREVEFNDIWKMKLTYRGLETTPIVTDLIFEDRSLNHTIHITFPGNTVALGYFKAPDSNSRFRFYLNDHFVHRI